MSIWSPGSWLWMVTGTHILNALFKTMFYSLNSFQSTEPIYIILMSAEWRKYYLCPHLLLSEPLKERVILLLLTLVTWGFQRVTKKNLTKDKIQRQHGGRVPVMSDTYIHMFTCLKSLGLAPSWFVFQPWLCHQLAIWPQRSYFSFLCLSSLIYKKYE